MEQADMTQSTPDEWIVAIEANGAWLCEHSDAQGGAAPSTRLTINEARIENPHDTPNRQRGYLFCPGCGTYWRAWSGLKKAKQYVAPPHERMVSPAAPYRRLRSRDIDEILAALRESIPQLQVTQHQQSWPGDDDGLWFFSIAKSRKHIQVESSWGQCPFIVEHSDMLSSSEAIIANSIQEVVQEVVSYLSRLEESGDAYWGR
jgi:hypothetical protein